MISLRKTLNCIISTSSPQDTFPFLSLPPELRQRIYGFCGPQHERFDICSDDEIDQVVRGLDRRAHPRVEPSVDLGEKDSLLQLLRTCRQINNEAASLMYRCNTFEIDVYIDTQWHKLKISEPYFQKEIHHVKLMIQCRNLEDPKDPDTIDPMWADLLGGLYTLEIVIEHPMSFYCKSGYLPGAGVLNDAEWNILLKRRLEVIKRLVPEGIEIMVDVDEDADLTKLVEEAIPNCCTFGDLEPGYYTFQRFKDLNRGFDDYSGDEYSDEGVEYLDFRDPDLDDPVLQELTRLTLAALPNIDPNDPDLPDMVRLVRNIRNSQELGTNGSN